MSKKTGKGICNGLSKSKSPIKIRFPNANQIFNFQDLDGYQWSGFYTDPTVFLENWVTSWDRYENNIKPRNKVVYLYQCLFEFQT